MEVLDLLGKLLAVSVDGNSVLEVAGIPNGTYFVRVWFANGSGDVKKIVINH